MEGRGCHDVPVQEPTKVSDARQVGAGRRLRRLMLGAGVVLAVSCSGYALVGGVTPVTVVAGQLVVAATFVATGFMAAARRPQNRTGTLMMVTGLALLVDLLQGPPVPALSIDRGTRRHGVRHRPCLSDRRVPLR